MGSYKDCFYHQVSFKASHNSYDKGLSLTQQIEQGFQGLELDISQSSDGKNWSVAHLAGYSDQNNEQLANYLEELETWSSNNPGHDVITINLDLKLVENQFLRNETFPTLLDQYLQANFDSSKIYKPGDLIRFGSLINSSLLDGFPTLKNLENKFIFCLTGDDFIPLEKEPAKTLYAKTNPKERLCFADARKFKNEAPNSDARIFFNYDFEQIISPNIRIREPWTQVFQGFIGKGKILRAYGLNTTRVWNEAIESGINILTTEKIDESWAKVGDKPFIKLKPL